MILKKSHKEDAKWIVELKCLVDIYANKNVINMIEQTRILLGIMTISVWRYVKENILVVMNAASTAINAKITSRIAKLLYPLLLKAVVMRINLNVPRRNLHYAKCNVKKLKVVDIGVLRNVHTTVPMRDVQCLFQRFYLVVDT